MNLYCWAHIRRYFVRAGDANPAQLTYWTAAWLERIKDLYAAHAQLMTAWRKLRRPRRGKLPPRQPGWSRPAPPGTRRSP